MTRAGSTVLFGFRIEIHSLFSRKFGMGGIWIYLLFLPEVFYGEVAVTLKCEYFYFHGTNNVTHRIDKLKQNPSEIYSQ